MGRNILKSSVENASFSIVFQVSLSNNIYNYSNTNIITLLDPVQMHNIHIECVYYTTCGPRCTWHYEREAATAGIDDILPM